MTDIKTKMERAGEKTDLERRIDAARRDVIRCEKYRLSGFRG